MNVEKTKVMRISRQSSPLTITIDQKQLENVKCFKYLDSMLRDDGSRGREGKQQDATNLMFIIKLLSQHVSGIIMPIIRRTRVCTAAYGVLHCNKRVTKP